MASTPATGAGEMACPDPSMHGVTPARLQDQASKAALLATGDKASGGSSAAGNHKDFDVLGPDGKLSSAGAATSLKHAKAQDLPSFPSVGIDTNSGNKAASLASANQKPFEHWKPELSSNASKAALLAANHGGKVNLWQPEASSTGLGAAGAAMGNQKGLSPQLDYGYTDDGRKKALLAATKSVSDSAKPKIDTPIPTSKLYPDEENSAYNALNAATAANRPGSRISGDHSSHGKFPVGSLDAARVYNTQGVPREMYTEHPPVAIEVEEKKHQDALRASAVSMAKQMYSDQQRQSTDSAGSLAARKVHAQSQQNPTTQQDIQTQAKQYLNLQDAAQRMAAERLAKLDPDGTAAYKDHYGYSNTPPKSRFSFRRSKDRSSTNAEYDDSSDDEAQASQIRSQMGTFNAKLAEVDAKKRDEDRKNLLAAAEKSVTARMRAMDQKAFEQTGKPTAALQQEWEAKARERAAADSEARMQNYGKVHIGGGKYMNESDVEAIAAARMQPTLDQINDTAEKQRARDEEIRLDQEQRKREAELEKQREKDTKAELKRQQDEEKAKQRAQKEEEKARLAQEKEIEKAHARLAKQDEKNAKDAQKEAEAAPNTTTSPKAEAAVPFTATAVPASEYIAQEAGAPGSSEPMEKLEEQVGKIKGSANAADAPNEGIYATEPTERPITPTSPVSPSKGPSRSDSKIKGFLGKFKRSSREPGKFSSGSGTTSSTHDGSKEHDEEGLYSAPSTAGDAKAPEGPLPIERYVSPAISPISDDGVTGRKARDSDDVDEARDTIDEDLAPPNRSSYTGSVSPNRGSKFQEEL